MAYISRLFLPDISVILRSAILIVLVSVSLAIYYGGVIGEPAHTLFQWFIDHTGLALNIRIIDVLLQLVLGIAVIIYVLKHRLFTGLVKGIHFYVLVVLMIALLSNLVSITRGGSVEPADVLVLVLIIGINLVLMAKYPPIALSVKYVGMKNKIEESDILRLDDKEKIVLQVIGSPEYIKITYDDEHIDLNTTKTVTGEIIEIRPRSISPGNVIIKASSNVIFKLRLSLKDTDTRELVFKLFFNDDEVGEEKINVERTKTLLEASYPAVKSILARIGLDESDIREIQFYNSRNVYLDPETRIYELIDHEIHVKIYSVEKHLELLRYYRSKDVFELWDKLMRRLQLLNSSVDEITAKVSEIIIALKTLTWHRW